MPRHYRERMRVGLVCPYSLTIPGGVQGQALGLARSLRSLGHEDRVLGPCDGPPPDAGVTPLGRSVPTAAKDRKSTRLNSSHMSISYAVFCLKKKSRRR